MLKKIKVTHTEQSKAVVVATSVEYEGESESLINRDVLNEAEQLFNEAQKFAKLKTMEKE